VSRYFTHYWTNDTWDEEAAKHEDGDTLTGIVGNQFSQRIQPGDSLYVMRVYEGDLYLLCRLRVKQVGLGESDDPRWRDRLDVNPSGTTPMRFNHVLTREKAFSLRFIPESGSDRLPSTASGGVEHMALRMMRELTEPSAVALDQWIAEYERLIPRAWIFQYNQTRYEIEEWVQEHGEVDWWDVTALWSKMSIGDRVYFRRSITRQARPTGISAIGRLLSPVYTPDPDKNRRVDLLFEWRVEPTLTVADIKNDLILGQKQALNPGKEGTNFSLTPGEAARLDELVTPKLKPFLPHTLVIDPSLDLDERTRGLMPVVLRQGQPEFRNRLIEAYGGRCAITDCDAIDALQAAHINPYLGPKTNHVTNGLLLRADIHTLFDRGLLAIDDERMTVILHPTLKATAYGYLDGTAIHPPAKAGQWPDKSALRHRRRLCGL
jgi:hypothetical protein